ncbi:unnamed protein product [Dicrocoelium dendriticum]|nr:unnamed protein product [Dicrocoelium dendriticum]
MRVVDLFRSSDAISLDYQDDTLVNRLCSCILCPDRFHPPFSDWNTEELEHVIINCLQNNRFCLSASDERCMQLLKLSLVIFFKFHTHLPAIITVEARRFFLCLHNLPQSYVSTALNAIHDHIKHSCALTDLAILDTILDQNILHFFHCLLLQRKNIHHSKILFSLFAHLTVYRWERNPDTCEEIFLLFASEFASLTATSLSYLLALNETSKAFDCNVAPISIRSPFPLTIDDINCSPRSYLAGILHMFCAHKLTYSDLGSDDVLSLFSNYQALPELCAKVIGAHLRLNSAVSGVVWSNVLSVWSSAVLDQLVTKSKSKLCALIDPLIHAQKTKFPSSNTCVKVEPALLSQAFSELFPPWDVHATDIDPEYREKIFLLLNVLMNCHVPTEIPLLEWLEHVKACIEPGLRQHDKSRNLYESKGLLDLCNTICRSLCLKGEKQAVIDFLHHLTSSLDTCDVFTVFVGRAFLAVAIIRENFFPVWGSGAEIVIFSILRALLVLHAACDSNGYPNLEWDRDSIFASCSKLLLEGFTVSVFWSPNSIAIFSEITRHMFSSSSSLLINPETRGTIL